MPGAHCLHVTEEFCQADSLITKKSKDQRKPENSCKNPDAATTKGCASKSGSGRPIVLKMLRVEQPGLAGATHDTTLERGDESGPMDSMPRTRTVRMAPVPCGAAAMPTMSDGSPNASHEVLARLRGDL